MNEEALLSELLRWYQRSGRKLPWRDISDPYEIWVSEVILQQTQVSRGIEYYQKFLDRFPTLDTLASARWPSVLKVWRGLGYYRRAENMQKTARIVRDEFSGKFPLTESELRALPGIGPYTAAALLSFSRGINVPAIDTNLNRVFQRLYGCPQVQVEERARALFRRKPRSSKKLNYSFMDLGSTLCKAKNPNCHDCPLQQHCHYGTSQRPNSLLRKPRKKTHKNRKDIIDVGIGCIHADGAYLIGKRPQKKGGKWEFPGGKKERKESIRATLKRELKEELGVEVSVRPPFHIASFTDNTFEWRLHFCRCRILRGKEKAIEHDTIEWVPKEELTNYPMPPKNEEAIKLLQRMR